MIARHVCRVFGVVQGVGFRPFVARLASELVLAGSVRNEGRFVRIDLEGDVTALARFAARLVAEAPPPAHVVRVAWRVAATRGARGFTIEPSTGLEAVALTIPPDLAPCDACIADIGDPSSRRQGYAFTSCARCGPRFTIVRALPYDRASTSMAPFAMCAACRREHDDLADRRYHAQPIACPACGPTLRASAVDGAPIAEGGAALEVACEAIRRGAIVALKGVGGFQLVTDATLDSGVTRLRERKRRPREPFAVMVRDLDEARRLAHVSALEAAALASASAPIVLAARRASALAPSIAPGLARVGLMLPSSPLHHLLLERVGAPVVATSANVHGEPLVTEDADARARLAHIADLVLGHDRAIVRRCDDSLVHAVLGEVRTLRLARGLAPARLTLSGRAPRRVLCAGAHLRNAPAILAGDEVVLWPHVGDLDSPLARRALEDAWAGLGALLSLEPEAIAVDAHPDYASTLAAEATELPLLRVHHHHAHVAACLAEHGVDEAIGVAWDGVGLGHDGELWGGEVLHVTPRGASRVASLRCFPLPGGDAAARDGRRALAGMLSALHLEPRHIGGPDVERFVRLSQSRTLSPPTTSAGRLFDAVAALLGVCERSSYEGQAAMELEALAERGAEPLPFAIVDGPGHRVIDWGPVLAALIAMRADAPRAASRFHATLAAMIADAVTESPAMRCGVVALSGGCFANALLLESAAEALSARGLRVIVPRGAPPGDGGIALGQAWIAMHRIGAEASSCA